MPHGQAFVSTDCSLLRTWVVSAPEIIRKKLKKEDSLCKLGVILRGQVYVYRADASPCGRCERNLHCTRVRVHARTLKSVKAAKPPWNAQAAKPQSRKAAMERASRKAAKPQSCHGTRKPQSRKAAKPQSRKAAEPQALRLMRRLLRSSPLRCHRRIAEAAKPQSRKAAKPPWKPPCNAAKPQSRKAAMERASRKAAKPPSRQAAEPQALRLMRRLLRSSPLRCHRHGSLKPQSRKAAKPQSRKL